MMKTITALTFTALVLAIGTSAFAQGGGYNWNGPRETYPNVVAQHETGEIFAGHPNAYRKGPSTVTTAVAGGDNRIFSGHPNSYHIARDTTIGIDSSIAVADR